MGGGSDRRKGMAVGRAVGRAPIHGCILLAMVLLFSDAIFATPNRPKNPGGTEAKEPKHAAPAKTHKAPVHTAPLKRVATESPADKSDVKSTVIDQSQSCYVPSLPRMFVIAAVPEDPGLYQVLHRRGDGSFVHYGRVHSAKPKSKKTAVDSTTTFTWTFPIADGSWNTNASKVMAGITKSMTPWVPLDVRDCNGKKLFSFSMDKPPKKGVVHKVGQTFKYNIYDGHGNKIGYTSMTDLRNSVVLFNKQHTRVARIHWSSMTEHQEVTVYQPGQQMSDVRLLAFVGSNQGMKDVGAAVNEEARKRSALAFLITIVSVVAGFLLCIGIGCILCHKYGQVELQYQGKGGQGGGPRGRR